jgi:hypothetical protein
MYSSEEVDAVAIRHQSVSKVGPPDGKTEYVVNYIFLIAMLVETTPAVAFVMMSIDMLFAWDQSNSQNLPLESTNSDAMLCRAIPFNRPQDCAEEECDVLWSCSSLLTFPPIPLYTFWSSAFYSLLAWNLWYC